MRVLIVDDHEIVRRGIRAFLGSHPNWEVCGEAVNGLDALVKARELNPDIVVMDISMPEMNGLEATRQLRSACPNLEVLILSQHESAEMARQALQAGARGFVVKGSVGRDLLTALQKVSRKELFFDPVVVGDRKGPVDVQEMESRSAILEEALRESEELYRSTFELSPIGVAHVDPNGNFIRVNPKFAQIVGYASEEMLHLSYQHITHPAELPTEVTQISRLVQGETTQESDERRYIDKNGGTVWVMRTACRVQDNAKNLKHLIFIIEDITERKTSEQARFRLAAIVDSSDDAIVSKDLNGIITTWNTAASQVFGYSPEEAIGQHITLIIPPELREEEIEIIRRLRAGERISHFETTRITKDGRLLDVSLTISPIKDSRGRIVGASKIARDISDRKRFASALQESEQRLRLAQAAAQIGTWEWDPITGRTSLSQDLHRFFGTDPADPEHQKQWFERVFPDDAEKVQTNLKTSIHTGEVEFEYRYVHPQNGLRWFYCKGRRFSEASSRMFGIVNDVTERKRAAEALREREQHLRAAFAQSYAFMALLDVTGKILEVNEAALQVIDASREQIIGKPFWEPWWAGIPEEVEAARKIVSRAVKGEAVRDECKYSIPDGTFRFAERTVSPVKDEDGNVVLLLASGLDMTEQKQLRESLEERVRARTADLERKNAEAHSQATLVRELSARLLQSQDDERRRIARELHDSAGQILTALQMNLAAVEPHHSALPDDAGRAIRDSIDLVGQLVQEIRTLSYLLHPPLLDEAGLHSALNWYVEGFSTRSKIATEIQISPDLGRLPRALETTIFRIVQECLTNIHRHSGSSSAYILLDRKQREVRIEVRDRGKGMSSGNGRGSKVKAGVGLRGMQERVHQFGGTLNIKSDKTGTSVSAVIPLPEDSIALDESMQETQVQ